MSSRCVVFLTEPLLMVTPSLLSITWFPVAESTRATAVALLANNVGAALAYVIGV